MSTMLIATKGRKRNDYIKSNAFYFVLSVLVNMGCQMLVTNGFSEITYTEWQPVYLIGSTNSFIFYYLTATLFLILYSITLKEKIAFGCMVFILLELFSLLIGGTTAGCCSMCLFLLCICFRVSKRFSTFVSWHMKAIVGGILLFFIVVII